MERYVYLDLYERHNLCVGIDVDINTRCSGGGAGRRKQDRRCKIILTYDIWAEWIYAYRMHYIHKTYRQTKKLANIKIHVHI
jgi:hypothetical protein